MHSLYPRRANIVNVTVDTVLTARNDLFCNRFVIRAEGEVNVALTLPPNAVLQGDELVHVKGIFLGRSATATAGAGSTVEGVGSHVFAQTNDAIELCYDKANTNWFIVTSHIQQSPPL